jgi:predicted amidohydrolase
MTSLKIALIQFNANADKTDNLKRALTYAHQAIEQGAQFILFPESFNQRGTQAVMRDGAESIPNGPSVAPFMALAKAKRVSILINVCQTPPDPTGKLLNTSLLMHHDGSIAAAYNKIHLFDVDIAEKKFRESDLFLSGTTPVLSNVSGVSVGLSICYDLRFPELYRHYAQHGAKILCIPASFTAPTGKAHWEILLRARAIENQCFVLAPAQTGPGANGVQTYGHSMAIDPWGNILCEGSEAQEDILIADLDFQAQDLLRRQFPVLAHAKSTIGFSRFSFR